MTGAWMWARSEIRRGWLSLVVVVLLVAITGGAVMAGVAGARRAGASVDRFLADANLAEITVYTQSPLDDALRADLEADTRIETIAASRVMLATPTSVEPGLGGATIAVPDEFWGELIRPRLVDGRYPAGPNEIAMTESSKGLGFEVGDRIAMHLLTYSALDACRNGGACTPVDAGDATITALVRLPSDLAPGPFGQGLFVAPAEFLDSRGGVDATFGYITDLFTADGADIDAIVTDYSTRVDDGDVTNAATNDVAGARRAAGMQRDALLIGTLIATAAGLLIAGQAFGRFLARRASDAPTLAAVGMGGGQRTVAGWMPGLVGSIAGTALAIPVAVALSPIFPLRIARRADPDVGVHADWTVIGIGSLAILAVAAVAALISAALWSRPSSVNGTMRSVSPITRLAQQLRLSPSPTMGSRFALEPGRGARRTPVVPSLIGASAAVAVAVGALLVTSSLDGLLSDPDRYGAPWDLQVSAGNSFAEAGALIASDDRVDGVAVAVSGELNLAVDGRTPTQGFAIGIEPVKGSVAPVVLEGRTPDGSNEVMLGSATFEALDAELGDDVEVSGPGGSETMIVVGRTIVPIIGSDFPDEGIVVPLGTLMKLGGTETVADVDVEGVVLATVIEPADIDAVGREIEEAGAALDGPFRQSSVTVLDEIRGIPLYVAAFTAFIGVLAAFHTLLVTARRRRNDLAVMRALGCRPGQAGGVIHWQGFFVAAAALVVGIPVGLIAGRLIWQSIAERANVLSVIDTPWSAIGIVAITAIVVTAFLLAIWPASTARRRRPGIDLRVE